MIRSILTVLQVAMIVMASFTFKVPTQDESEMETSWADRLQVYAFVPMPLEWNMKFHVSVHGLWAGVRSANTPLPSPEFSFWLYGRKFDSAADYVSWIHDNGMLVSACINNIPCSPDPQKSDILTVYPELEEAACRDINGEVVTSSFGGATSYWMCQNNPTWRDWLIEQGKRCVDIGVDIILLDELIGNALMVSPEPNHIGFCDYCMNGFRDYLRSKFTVEELREKFGIENIEDFNYREYLLQSGMTSMSKVRGTPLWDEFMRFQDEANFEAKKRITDELRSYIKQEGRSTLIAGNMYLPFVRFLHYASLCDMLTIEVHSNIPPNMGEWIYPPRGKWLTIYRQANAIIKGLVVTLPSVDWEGYGKAYENYICIMFAEAYSSQGAFAIYRYGEAPLEKLANYTRFVTENRDLYEDSELQSSIAVVDLYTTFPPPPTGIEVYNRDAAYQGLAQALAESGIPFNVEFAGDGLYIPNNLTAEQLKKYKIILIPSAMNITESQRRVVEEYVMEGGIAVVPANHGFNTSREEGVHTYGEGEFIVTGVDSSGRGLGLQYWYTYNDQVREQIASLVKSNLEEPPLTVNVDRTAVLFPYYQPERERIVIHLVNYDYDPQEDEVNPKENIRIQIKRPLWLEGELEAFLVSPDFGERIALQYVVSGDYINLTIPKLDIYDVVVIEPVTSEIDATPPSISSVEYYPKNATASEDVVVTAMITDDKSGVKNASLYYSVDRGTWQRVQMNEADLWWMYNATILGQSDSREVRFYIEAYDEAGNKAETSTQSYGLRSYFPLVETVAAVAIVAAAGGAAWYALRKKRQKPRNDYA